MHAYYKIIEQAIKKNTNIKKIFYISNNKISIMKPNIIVIKVIKIIIINNN